jgi:hypothetical protein
MSNQMQPQNQKELELAIARNEQQLEQMNTAIELAKNLQQLGPMVTDFGNLVINLRNASYAYLQQRDDKADRQDRRRFTAQLLDKQLDRLHALHERLMDQLQAAPEGPTKDRYLTELRQSMTEANNLLQKLIGEL